MSDPLAEVVTLLQPSAPFSKLVSGAGPWSVRRAEAGTPFYCAILDGASRLAVDGREPVILENGDFVLIPAAFDFTASSLEPPQDTRDSALVVLPDGEVRHGTASGPPDVCMLVGYCVFASPDAHLLVSLLPQFVHVRGEPRLSTLVEFVREEARQRRPAREVILARLLEVLLIEALRSTAGTAASANPRRRLADARLAVALRRMHENPTRAWTVAQLAHEAALARSAFFERLVVRWVLLPWNTCSAGAWRWPKTCCGAGKSRSPRLPPTSATTPQAPSALPSRGTSDCRQPATHRSKPTRDTCDPGDCLQVEKDLQPVAQRCGFPPE